MCEGLKPYYLVVVFFIHAQECVVFFFGGGLGREWGRGFKMLTVVVPIYTPGWREAL